MVAEMVSAQFPMPDCLFPEYYKKTGKHPRFVFQGIFIIFAPANTNFKLNNY
jgi:hypothetical protein